MKTTAGLTVTQFADLTGSSKVARCRLPVSCQRPRSPARGSRPVASMSSRGTSTPRYRSGRRPGARGAARAIPGTAHSAKACRPIGDRRPSQPRRRHLPDRRGDISLRFTGGAARAQLAFNWGTRMPRAANGRTRRANTSACQHIGVPTQGCPACSARTLAAYSSWLPELHPRGRGSGSSATPEPAFGVSSDGASRDDRAHDREATRKSQRVGDNGNGKPPSEEPEKRGNDASKHACKGPRPGVHERSPNRPGGTRTIVSPQTSRLLMRTAEKPALRSADPLRCRREARRAGLRQSRLCRRLATSLRSRAPMPSGVRHHLAEPVQAGRPVTERRVSRVRCRRRQAGGSPALQSARPPG
jgi:hypothetical protein